MKQRGFTLIEVMVAFVIMAIGLLGMTSLITMGTKTNSSAYAQSQAVILAGDLADRIRAARSQNFSGVDLALVAEAGSCVVTSGTLSAGIGATPCGDFVSHDVADWLAEVRATLPAAEASVCIDSTPNDGEPGAEACDGAGTVQVVKIWWASNTVANQLTLADATPNYRRVSVSLF